MIDYPAMVFAYNPVVHRAVEGSPGISISVGPSIRRTVIGAFERVRMSIHRICR